MTSGSGETNPSQDERLSHLESQIDTLREMVSGLVKILSDKKDEKESEIPNSEEMGETSKTDKEKKTVDPEDGETSKTEREKKL